MVMWSLRSTAILIATLLLGVSVGVDAQSLTELPGSEAAGHPDISGDGRFVVFESDRLDGVGGADIYLYDRQQAGLVPLPGLNSRGSDFAPSIDANGRLIAFASNQPSGVGREDVYLYDRDKRALVELPGLNTRRGESAPIVSHDGRFIGFQAGSDIRLYDRSTGRLVDLRRVNTRDTETLMAMSESGRFFAFFRERSSLVARPENFLGDYLYDRESDMLIRLPDHMRVTDISADGRFLLVPLGQTPLYDRIDGSYVSLPGRIAISTVAAVPKMSRDMRVIVYVSFSGGNRILIYDREGR